MTTGTFRSGSVFLHSAYGDGLQLLIMRHWSERSPDGGAQVVSFPTDQNKKLVLHRVTVRRILKTMETILEQQRRYHEEKERLMDAKTKEMLHKKSTVSWPLYDSFSTVANQTWETFT